MSRSVLFGYTVEEVDGRIVITLSGSLANAVFRNLTSATARHRSGIDGLLSPLAGLTSSSVSLSPAPLQENNKPNIKEIFAQGFDRPHSEFEEQLSAYRALLSQAGAESAPQSANTPIDPDSPE
jgi:hypothetical protein